VKRIWIRRAVYLFAGACTLDALIEPYLLTVAHHRLTVPELRAPLRIAHVSDLHVQSFGLREKALLAALEVEKPDLIAITGDTVDGGDLEVARPLLKAMHAPLGVLAVAGNWEHWRPVHGDQAAFYASVGARFLRNESVRLRPDLIVIGLDDALSGDPDARAFRSLGEGLHLALFHAPIGIDMAKAHAHVALAGHTHGGQVRVPFFGPLWRPPGSAEFDRGWYSRDGVRMHVSSGLGTSIFRVRFACRPELAILDLSP
jgi:uncharacterized protein